MIVAVHVPNVSGVVSPINALLEPMTLVKVVEPIRVDPLMPPAVPPVQTTSVLSEFAVHQYRPGVSVTGPPVMDADLPPVASIVIDAVLATNVVG